MRGNERSHDDCGHDRRTSTESGEASPVFLDARETAALLQVSVTTLGRWRVQGAGPAYLKTGRRVLYDRAVVIAWLNEQRRQSTSEAEHAPPAAAPTALRSTQWFRKNGWR
jgi:predicted DNA-binding transcriptional regulator AlpA